MTWYGGMSPMPTVPAPMVSMVMTSVRFRPIRSPKWPKIRRADWAGAEADEVGGEREQHPGVRVLPGKEDLGKDEGGDDPVEQEVIELDGAARSGGRDGAAGHDRLPGHCGTSGFGSG